MVIMFTVQGFSSRRIIVVHEDVTRKIESEGKEREDKQKWTRETRAQANGKRYEKTCENDYTNLALVLCA